MSLSRFRLITFDVTDTLLQFRTSPGKQYGEIGAMFGILTGKDDVAANFKSNWYENIIIKKNYEIIYVTFKFFRHKMNRAHPNFGLKTKIGYEAWWKKLVLGTFHDSGVQIPDDKLEELSDHLLGVYKTSTCWQTAYGSVEFLNYLKLQQQLGAKENSSKTPPFKMGVISNFDHRLDVLLRNMKINHYFDFVTNSYDAGFLKPDKEIFHKAMKWSEIKDLRPEECLHIGDTPLTDYLGAKACGWHAALIHEKDPEYLRNKYGNKIEDHTVFGSLFDLHKKISSDFISW